MKNLKKNWMTALLIGGAYLCVAGNAMAFNVAMYSNSVLLANREANFKIEHEEKSICNGKAKVNDAHEKGLCTALIDFKKDTELKIKVWLSHEDNIICDASFTYKPNRDIFVELKSGNKCSIGLVK